jgi:hypothetical protein
LAPLAGQRVTDREDHLAIAQSSCVIFENEPQAGRTNR